MKYLKLFCLIFLIISIELLYDTSYLISLEVNNESNIIDLKVPTIIYKNKKSIFKATLINNSDKNKFINNVEIIVRDNMKNIICTFKIDINKNINKSEKINLEYIIQNDLSDATSFDYIVN